MMRFHSALTVLSLAASLMTVACADTPPAPPIPSQATVAAKADFGTVSRSDPSVAKALDAEALPAAQKLVGTTGSFQGTVTKVYSPKTHSFVALDFAPNYHDALTADIAPENYAKFPDLTTLEGKHVLITGLFVQHGEAVQVAVIRLGQIKVVQ